MMRWSATSTAPTWRPRHTARSRVATASSMKYCSGVGRTAALRTLGSAMEATLSRRSAGALAHAERARELARGRLVHLPDHRAVHDHVLAALLHQVGQEGLDEPLAAVGDGRPGADAYEVGVEVLDLLDPGRADEPGRARRHEPGHLGDELTAGLLAGREELDLGVARTPRLHAHRLDLVVVHPDHLAVDGPQACRAQADLVDDAADLERLDGDVVAHREPALEEHEEPGQDVGHEALRGEADQDDDQRRARDGAEPVAEAERAEREHQRQPVRGVTHARAHEGDGGLAPLEGGDDARVGGAVLAQVARLAAAHDPGRQSPGELRD